MGQLHSILVEVRNVSINWKSVALTLARPLHVRKSRPKQGEGKDQASDTYFHAHATLISDFRAHARSPSMTRTSSDLAGHLMSIGKIVGREESGQSKDFEESDVAVTPARPLHVSKIRPKQGEGKDQASDTYK